MRNDQKTRLHGIQSLRGLAALAVLFQHITFYACTAKGVDYMPYLRIDFGRFGVQLFFVISGFVMAGCMSQGKTFLWHRVLRIYPSFWLAILATCALLANPYFDWHFDWKSALLIPSGDLNNTYRIPYWTLVYEIAFYLVTYAIALLGGSKTLTVRVCMLWLAVIVVASKYVTMNYVSPGIFILASKWNVYFIFGMLAALYAPQIKQIPTIGLSVVAVTLWTLGDAVAPISGDLLTAGAFSALLIAAIESPRVKMVERFGDLSFGVYLMHVPIAVLTIHEITRLFPSAGLFYLWVSTITIALVGSLIFGIVETRIHGMVKTFSSRQFGKTVPSLDGTSQRQ